jgi:8-oxo-dGTP pyrophosphatase MutT (NUDIX family)
MNTNITAAGFILLNYDSTKDKWKIFCLIDNNGFYDLPKGVIDEGESILEAAKRELFEETNIDINNEKIFKTWVNWDLEWKELKEESIDNISIQGSSFENSLRLFFAEVEESIIEEVKILPNPYTNIKEHINYRFIGKEEFESENTPDYLRESFSFVMNKLRLLGEERGFKNGKRGKY